MKDVRIDGEPASTAFLSDGSIFDASLPPGDHRVSGVFDGTAVDLPLRVHSGREGGGEQYFLIGGHPPTISP